MSAKFERTNRYVQQLKETFNDLEVPTYKLRSLYSRTHHVFFDCESQDQVECLKTTLKQRQFNFFTVFIVMKEPSGSLKFMDVNFRNIGKETLEHFINRFHTTLEPSMKLSLQMVGSEYVECIGHSYSEL